VIQKFDGQSQLSWFGQIRLSQLNSVWLTKKVIKIIIKKIIA